MITLKHVVIFLVLVVIFSPGGPLGLLGAVIATWWLGNLFK